MPFGYSRKIFKYPSVQYIPLDPYDERNGNYERLSNKVKIYLFSLSGENKLRKKLNQLGIEENYSVENGEIGVLLINGKVNLIQYRAYEVIMVGTTQSHYYHLFKVTTKYFYKDNLVFTFYNGATSERLDLVRYEQTPVYRTMKKQVDRKK